MAYRCAESTRVASERPAKDMTLTQAATWTGGLCLGGMDPVSHDML